MRFDVGQPILSGDKSRDETFIVFFDGFIKNPSEGIMRSMLRDYEDWIFFYPKLEKYQDLSTEEIYDETMIVTPVQLLRALCDGVRTDEQIEEDLEKISQLVFVENSKMTTFEYSLYNLIQEAFLKKCYFYKEGKFTPNEIRYIRRKYRSVIEKIEIVDEVNFPSFIEEVNPTTIFINDPSFIFDYFAKEYDEDFQIGKLFIVLNSELTVHYNEQLKVLEYNPEFKKMVDKLNEESPFSISPMFNFRIEDVNNFYNPDMEN